MVSVIESLLRFKGDSYQPQKLPSLTYDAMAPQCRDSGMTAAERARHIDEQEFRAESAAALQRALAYSASKRREERARLAQWFGREEPQIKHKTPRGRPAKLYTHDGVSRTLSEWALIAGVSLNVITNRVRRGMPFELAILPTLRQPELHVVNGVWKTMAEWADYAGCSYDALMQRIRRHSLSDAVSLKRPLPTPGVVSDLQASSGTGGGSTTQEIPNIDFSQDAAE